MADGLRLAKVEAFDLYILDSKLPDGRGAELCVKIREFDRATPIIFYTAEPPEQLRSELKDSAQEYVIKPEFDDLEKAILERLKRCVRKLLDSILHFIPGGKYLALC